MGPDPGDEGRRVVHVNITDFMAQAEEVRDPSLRGRPFAVGNPRAPRSVLLGVSRAAYAEGVRPGMGLREAARICRGLTLVEPDHQLYAALGVAHQRAPFALLGQSVAVARVGHGKLVPHITGPALEDGFQFALEQRFVKVA